MSLTSVTNYLVPATGSTNAFSIRQNFSATPYYQEFSSQGLDGIPFRPSGVIIDNSQGTGPLTVLINENSYRMVVPAGAGVQLPYPAPLNHTVNITGQGDATVIFVDYPVLPYSSVSGGGGSVPNPLPVTGPLTDTELRAASVPVSGPLTDAELRAASVNVVLPTTARTPALTSVTASGTVAAGSRMVSVKNVGAAAGTLAGVAFPAGQSVTWLAQGNDTLGSVAYNATGTTYLIATA